MRSGGFGPRHHDSRLVRNRARGHVIGGSAAARRTACGASKHPNCHQRAEDEEGNAVFSSCVLLQNDRTGDCRDLFHGPPPREASVGPPFSEPVAIAGRLTDSGFQGGRAGAARAIRPGNTGGNARGAWRTDGGIRGPRAVRSGSGSRSRPVFVGSTAQGRGFQRVEDAVGTERLAGRRAGNFDPVLPRESVRWRHRCRDRRPAAAERGGTPESEEVGSASRIEPEVVGALYEWTAPARRRATAPGAPPTVRLARRRSAATEAGPVGRAERRGAGHPVPAGHQPSSSGGARRSGVRAERSSGAAERRLRSRRATGRSRP